MRKLLLGWIVVAASLTACGGTEQEAQEAMMPEENPSTLVMEGVGMSEQPVDTYQEADPSAVEPAASCWVVLEYCKSPSTGGPVCTYRNCTPQRAIRECNNLVRKNC